MDIRIRTLSFTPVVCDFSIDSQLRLRFLESGLDQFETGECSSGSGDCSEQCWA